MDRDEAADRVHDMAECHARTGAYHCSLCGCCCQYLGCPYCDEETYVACFVHQVTREARVLLAPHLVGRITSFLPVVGGGERWLLVQADDLLIRLTYLGFAWVAEHLIVAPRKA